MALKCLLANFKAQAFAQTVRYALAAWQLVIMRSHAFDWIFLLVCCLLLKDDCIPLMTVGKHMPLHEWHVVIEMGS
jgi:hypothetical protein